MISGTCPCCVVIISCFFLEGERERIGKGERVRVMKFDVYKDRSVPTFIGDGIENLIFVVI